MKNKKTIMKLDRRGSVLVLAVIIVLILATLGIGLIRLGQNARLQAVKATLKVSARSAADAGMEHAVERLSSVWDGLTFKNISEIESFVAGVPTTSYQFVDGDDNTDTFGANGEYTHYVKNRVRSLEKFWDMPNLISVRGQHTSTLEDLNVLRYVYENYSSAPPEVIDYLLGIAENFNTTSDQIPENPLYASDGFATFGGIIVVGDGIVSMLAETGLDAKVVWSGILAHEWGHQIQFQNWRQASLDQSDIVPFCSLRQQASQWL